MTAVDAAEQRVQELQALLTSVRAARPRTPSLRRATGTVGSPSLWAGTAAHRLHHDELVPLTDRLAHGLDRAKQAVLDDPQQALRAMTRAEDEQEAAERRSAS